MSSKKVFDAVATVGTYTHNGVEKKRYLNVGAVFENDDGKLSMKLEALPTSKEWSGWISFYEPKSREERAAAPARAREPEAAAAAPAEQQQFDDDIPF